MRKITLLFALILALFFACKNGGTNTGEADQSAAQKESPFSIAMNRDTLLIAELDSLHDAIQKLLETGLNPTETPMVFEGENMNMSYYDLPDNRARWDAKFSPEGFERYATFFLKDGLPFLFRFREWDHASSGTGEVYVYLDDGKIFYAKDRSMLLAGRQTPNLLLGKPHMESQRTGEELKKLMMTYYPDMKQGWDNRDKNK